MQLLRLGKRKWTVLALKTGRDGCPVLDLLRDSGPPGERLLADLRESIPERGPPKNKEASAYLRDHIFEFREPVSKGGTLRVLYFYDKGHVIVCANGVLKKKDKTPDALIDEAVDIRDDYLAAKARNDIRIEILPAEDEIDGEDDGCD